MNKLKAIVKGEDNLVQEIANIVDASGNLPLAFENNVSAKEVKAVVLDTNKALQLPQAEAVVVAFMRPLLYIQNNKITLPESNELKERIIKYKPIIEKPLKSVGRIELRNHQLKNLGTGWLIANDMIVTNRHVAEIFAQKVNAKALGGVFKKNFIGAAIEAKIDFKEEYQNLANASTNQFEIDIEKVIFLADDNPKNPDIAILKIKSGNNLPDPIPFITDKLKVDQLIGVVGYPFQDPRGVTDAEMEKRIFNSVFGVKRYAPGQVIGVKNNDWFFMHDASTLGGNSGSLVQDMESGCAIGLHFSGVLLEGNYAVKGSEILNAAARAKVKNVVSFSAKQASKVNIEAAFVLEAPLQAADYDDRKGFDMDFLKLAAAKNTVKLPTIKNKKDVLAFGKNNAETVLKYTHFSVCMSKERRICHYSAVNIDGKQYVRLKRTGWRFDPRIAETAQIMNECYGNAPKYSRGHMTRREDPNWGPLASLGNDDSMHVTNTVPQMQPFNAGVWLTLENYALENAKADHQKISVMTGPFLRTTDPVQYGVKIPVEFWKIIVFVNDQTNKLCATGYTISQEDYITKNEFVFGEFNTYQVPIKLIEKKAGISFGTLSSIDPLKDEVFESILAPLTSVRQVRYV